MRSVRKILFLGVFWSCVTIAQQPGRDDRYLISLSISGVPVEGLNEQAKRAMGKTSAQQNAILNEALPTLIRGQTFQLSVQITDPAGTIADYTASTRLKYESFGCLGVSATGFVNVNPSVGCKGPALPLLWIIFTDIDGKPIEYNQYLFKVN